MGGGGGGVRIGMNLYIGIDQLLRWGPHTSVSSEKYKDQGEPAEVFTTRHSEVV